MFEQNRDLKKRAAANRKRSGRRKSGFTQFLSSIGLIGVVLSLMAYTIIDAKLLYPMREYKKSMSTELPFNLHYTPIAGQTKYDLSIPCTFKNVSRIEHETSYVISFNREAFSLLELADFNNGDYKMYGKYNLKNSGAEFASYFELTANKVGNDWFIINNNWDNYSVDLKLNNGKRNRKYKVLDQESTIIECTMHYIEPA